VTWGFSLSFTLRRSDGPAEEPSLRAAGGQPVDTRAVGVQSGGRTRSRELACRAGGEGVVGPCLSGCRQRRCWRVFIKRAGRHGDW
jgi:hypothetical protein